MTDREKLIELQKQATTLYLDYLESIDQKGLTDTEGRAKFTADYLLANGVIVPPCKVGDTVWDRNGEPHKVVSIEWYSKRVMHLHCEHHTFSVGKRSIGKTVFLTKEEAENELAKRGEQNAN